MDHPVSIAVGVVAAILFAWWSVRVFFQQADRAAQSRRRVLTEDALKHLHHCEYLGQTASLESLAGVLRISRNRAVEVVERLELLGLARSTESGPRLTDEGRRDALRVVRLHRLLEKHLAEQTGVDESRWHEEADRREHLLSPEQVEKLALEMGDPRFDPHGSPIPTEEGEIAPPVAGGSLVDLPPGEHAVIVEIEDEPKAVYAQLVAEGLTVGTPVRIMEASPERLRVEAFGEEHVLAPLLAANVWVRRLVAAPPGPETWQRLSDLEIGRRAKVVGVSPHCRGPQRRRLLDLGFVPGTIVRAELPSPGGDPVGYLVRGTLIALRHAQAEMIRIEPMDNGVVR